MDSKELKKIIKSSGMTDWQFAKALWPQIKPLSAHQKLRRKMAGTRIKESEALDILRFSGKKDKGIIPENPSVPDDYFVRKIAQQKAEIYRLRAETIHHRLISGNLAGIDLI